MNGREDDSERPNGLEETKAKAHTSHETRKIKYKKKTVINFLDPSILIFSVFAIVSGIFAFFVSGPEAILNIFTHDAQIFIRIVPMLLAGLLISAFVPMLIRPEQVSAWIGRESGVKGLIIGGFAGAFTPGGPFTSFPLVLALHRAGADIGATVAFVTGWSVIGLHRLFVWELPIIGPEFALIRWLSSLPLPVMAGLVARVLAARFLPGDRHHTDR